MIGISVAATFKDHFSDCSEDYQRYRPRYPMELFAYLASISPSNETAWDCATGTGQTARGLAAFFKVVVATDASKNQLQNAHRTRGVAYVVGTAENSIFRDRTVDLITVSQALHWFQIGTFFKEADRVLKPNGILAAWTYNLLSVAPDIDEMIARFYKEMLGAYWPEERGAVETGYRDIVFPFQAVSSPPFEMKAQWNLDALMGYLSTWSAVRRFQKIKQASPIPSLYAQVSPLWGAPDRKYEIRWALTVKIRKKTAEDAFTPPGVENGP